MDIKKLVVFKRSMQKYIFKEVCNFTFLNTVLKINLFKIKMFGKTNSPINTF